MSMVVAPRTQRRDKSANGQKQPQATAEQMRLAQIIDGNGKEEDRQYQLVEKVMEVTGTTEDNARTALYDANNDTGRAIELILENGSFEQNSEWETAGRKKSKGPQNPPSKAYDTFDEDIKDTAPSSGGRYDRTESRGRGRGRNTNRRRADQDKSTEDDGRGNSENRDKNRGARRGRGRGGSYASRGRQPGRGPRRFVRYNRERSENAESGAGEGALNNFDEEFGTFTNKSAENAAATNEAWGADNEEWDLKVGTWSNDDSKKQTEKKSDSYSEPWGTDSWADDLTETKVFQSQNAQIAPPTSIAGALHSAHIAVQNHNPTQGTAPPQMGERIDIGALFKKNSGPTNDSTPGYGQSLGSNGLPGQSGLNYSSNEANSTPSVIHQLQGQSSSLFSDNKPVNDLEASSRLFTSYENQTQNSSVGAGSIGPYTSTRSSDTSYSQFNGKLGVDSSDRNSSSLLGSFGEQFKSQEKPVQSGMLGQISDLSKSAFTPLKPNPSQGVTSAVVGSEYSSFTQTQQQREATEAVKASLGLSPVNNDQLDTDNMHSGLPGLSHTTSMSQNTLSFGAPLPMRQSKEPRRKQPPVNTKIPAAAVEMPGVGGGGYHDLSTFDLQFGIDDNCVPTATNEFGSVNTVPGKPVTQNSLFSKGAVTSQGSIRNHIPSGSITDNSMFPNQLSSQQTESRPIQRSSYQSLQNDFSQTGKQLGATGDSLSLSSQQATDPTSLHGSQRFSEAGPKQNEPLRGPPGLTHPSSLSSSSNSIGNSHGSITGSNQQGGDLSASYGSSRMVPGQLSAMSSESTHDPTGITNSAHSYYTSTSLGQSQQQLGSDHSSSAGRSMRSPVPSTSLQGSLQGSPMPHMSVTPSKDDLPSGVASTAISSLASGLGQTHITSHASGPSETSPTAPLNIPGATTTNAPTLGGTGAYGSMGMHLPYSASPQASQASAIPTVTSPGKHLPTSDLYPSGLPSSLHHNHQQSTSTTVSTMIGSALGNAALSSVAGTPKSSTSLSTPSTKTGPPNLPLGVPPLLPNQYGIPMGAGLMTAYAPEAALYAGYTDPLMAVPSRVVNPMPNYYDVSSFHTSNNQTANPTTVNRETTASNVNQGKFGHREQSSPTSVIGMIGGSVGSGLAQQVAGQHGAQLKASQTGTHQAQPFVNLPTAPAAYPGYANVYYNAFQYPPMFAAAAATAVPQSGKHNVNVTTAFQQHGTGFGNAYSTASINASTASSLHDLQGQGYNKNHVSAYEKQQAAFHHHTNTPPPAFNLQTLTAAMAAANNAGAGGGAAGPGMSPYTQSPFMTMLPTHPNSQIHLHVQQQHGDVGHGVGSQRGQNTNTIGKSTAKPGFGSAPYWGN